MIITPIIGIFIVVVLSVRLLKVLGLRVAIFAVLYDIVYRHQQIGDTLLIVQIQWRKSHQTKILNHRSDRLGQPLMLLAPRSSTGHIAEQRMRIGLQILIQMRSGRLLQQIHFAQDIHVWQLHIRHYTKGGHRAGQKFRTINHELRIDQKYAAHAKVPRLQQFDELAASLQMCVQLNLAGHIEEDVIVIWITIHIVCRSVIVVSFL